MTRITIGFFLCACGTVLALNSKLGLSPWDVFHQGLSRVTGLTIGQSSIAVGLFIVIIASMLGVKAGVGTIANMVVIGCFIDLIMYMDFIPVCRTFYGGVFMMIASMFTTAFGCFLYIGCEMGCGPRDGLMVALMKITGKPVSLIRLCLETGAMVIGWMLGGFIGIGTLMTAFGIGYCVQIVFKVFDFDVNSLEHRNMKQGLVFLNDCISHNSI